MINVGASTAKSPFYIGEQNPSGVLMRIIHVLWYLAIVKELNHALERVLLVVVSYIIFQSRAEAQQFRGRRPVDPSYPHITRGVVGRLGIFRANTRRRYYVSYCAGYIGASTAKGTMQLHYLIILELGRLVTRAWDTVHQLVLGFEVWGGANFTTGYARSFKQANRFSFGEGHVMPTSSLSVKASLFYFWGRQKSNVQKILASVVIHKVGNNSTQSLGVLVAYPHYRTQWDQGGL
ncbi:hypothetical protein BDZ91DRAFT_814278 [Kalaharituber pfeilii]|nr:hypothetical protein BDZ91DRAFT_814278 [Kalaharituber pfeilii]